MRLFQIPMICILLLANSAFAGQGKSTTEKSSDKDADAKKKIMATIEGYVAAFNKGDAKAVVSFFTKDAKHTNVDGETLSGTQAIEKDLINTFSQNKGLKIEVEVQSIQVVKSVIAVERGTAIVTSAAGRRSVGDYTAVYTLSNNKWLLASIHEDRKTVEPPPAASQYEHLKKLEWLVGKWIDEDENSSVKTECHWTPNKNFLVRNFEVNFNGTLDVKGTQIIGWDPINKQIKSWAFDTNGTITKGTLVQKDDRWLIKASMVFANGSKGSSENILTMVDKDSFKWQSVGREVDGQLMPNIPEVTIKRVQ